MKTYLHRFIATLALSLTFLPAVALAEGPNPTDRVNRLDALVGLTPEQRTQAAEIFREENAAVDAIGGSPIDQAVKSMPIRQQSRAQIRELLSPVQRKIYDVSPQTQGGGSMTGGSGDRVSRLNALVGLTADQQGQAAEIFRAEDEELGSIGGSLEDRAKQSFPVRQESRAKIRALLTPEQRRIYDVSPQTAGGGSTAASPDLLVARIDHLLSLTPDQKRQATAIIANEQVEQIAATPEDQAPKGFRWRQATIDQLRAILTAEQQQIYDSTPVFQGGGKMGRGTRQ